MAISYPSSAKSSSEEPPNPIREGLEQLRKRLLDLTRRNKLLNFRHGVKSSLRVVDELPDELFKYLKDDTKLVFRPIPEPETDKQEETEENLATLPYATEPASSETTTRSSRRVLAKEHAAKLGISTSYDLPQPTENGANPKHFDRIIQTLHYPDDLEGILRQISGSARTAIEESGTNMLYLVFGFLEWYESADSNDPLCSPLLALPVEITRNKPSRASGGMFEFSIEHTGEDLLTNLSLVERMKRDFALSIPMLGDDDTPEGYFKRFEEILKLQPRWRIRRQITLTLLQFGKLLMFMDLDLSRHSSLLSHPRVNELLGGTSLGEESSYGEVYALDDPTVAQDLPPIIYDADSSQHSALIDVLRGKNIVIEGPPGTGKSQTITNLIAASLARGKTVLFVSEKLAALEVVRRRLDQAGLGHFCLELHSHKTKKDKLLKDIHERIQKQQTFRDAADLEDKIKLLERNRHELTQYVHLINQPFGALGKTIFDIIWTRDNLLQRHPSLKDISDQVALAHAEHITPVEREHQRLLVEIYQQHLTALLESYPSVESHPWSGINNGDLHYAQEHEVQEKLERLSTTAAHLGGAARSLFEMTGASLDASFKTLHRLADLRASLPDYSGNEFLILIPKLRQSDSRKSVKQYLEALSSWDKNGEDLRSYFSGLASLDQHASDGLEGMFFDLQALGLSRHTKGNLSLLSARVGELYANLRTIIAVFEEVIQLLGISQECTWASLPLLTEIAALLKGTDFDILQLRHPILSNSVHDQTRNKAQAEAVAIRRLKAQLSQEYVLSRLPSSDELWRHATVVSTSSFIGRLFNADYRAARNCYFSIRKDREKVDWSVMAVDLKELAEYVDQVKTFSSNSQFHEAFGPCFHGIETPFKELALLQGWYSDLRARVGPHIQCGPAFSAALQNLPVNTLQALARVVLQNASTLDLLGTLSGQLDGLPFSREDAGSPRANQSLDDFAKAMARTNDQLKAAVDHLTPIPFHAHVTIDEMASLLERASTFRATEERLNNDATMSSMLGDHYQGCLTDRRGLEATLSLSEKVCHEDMPNDIQDWLLTTEYPSRVDLLGKCLQDIQSQLSQFSALWAEFTAFVRLDSKQWYAETVGEWEDFNVSLICSRLDRARKNPLSLSEWLDYIRSRNTLGEVHLDTILAHAEQGTLKPAHLQGAYDFAIYNGLSSLILKAHPTLLNFSRSRHEKIREQFVKMDSEIQDLYRVRAAYHISRREVPRGNGTGPVRDYTERALLEHELQKQRGHIPIRTLLNRAHKTLLGLKPCFMMGPMSVAQYLEPGKFQFDLVVMDEASQLKPEDALGAISRGSQIVIVGDPKQLPPTTFFDTMFEELGGTEAENDSLAIEESESILDRACEVYKPIRQLLWHYRSRHESLIAFSNHRFYNQNLIPERVNEFGTLAVGI